MKEAGSRVRSSVEATRVNNVFTTHTSVPAGIDLFDSGLIYDYFAHYCEQAGFPFREAAHAGRKNLQDRDRTLFHGGAGVEDLGLSVTRSASCTGKFRRRCSRISGPRCRSGSADHIGDQRRARAHAGSTAIWPISTINTYSPIGASD